MNSDGKEVGMQCYYCGNNMSLEFNLRTLGLSKSEINGFFAWQHKFIRERSKKCKSNKKSWSKSFNKKLY